MGADDAGSPMMTTEWQLGKLETAEKNVDLESKIDDASAHWFNCRPKTPLTPATCYRLEFETKSNSDSTTSGLEHI